MNIMPNAKLISFEPHPISFNKLQQLSFDLGFISINSAVGTKSGNHFLYDYNSNIGSEHASMVKGVIEGIHGANSNSNMVEVVRLDEYLLSNNINFVDLLKIDVEGSELEVLKGFSDFLKNDKISIIQFEFNEMNILSKVFFRDFLALMPNFFFFRLLRDGMIQIDNKSSIYNEIFVYQNIIAINKKNLKDKKLKKFW
jgi:FkbM family methyltransferase